MVVAAGVVRSQAIVESVCVEKSSGSGSGSGSGGGVEVEVESEVKVEVEAHMVVAVVGEAQRATCQRNQSYKRLPRDNA